MHKKLCDLDQENLPHPCNQAVKLCAWQRKVTRAYNRFALSIYEKQCKFFWNNVFWWNGFTAKASFCQHEHFFWLAWKIKIFTIPFKTQLIMSDKGRLLFILFHLYIATLMLELPSVSYICPLHCGAVPYPWSQEDICTILYMYVKTIYNAVHC
jgi:hypothetical protein